MQKRKLQNGTVLSILGNKNLLARSLKNFLYFRRKLPKCEKTNKKSALKIFYVFLLNNFKNGLAYLPCFKSYHVYSIIFLKVCLTIYEVIFLSSVFDSQGVSLFFTKRMGDLKYTELSYRSCWQGMSTKKFQAILKAFYQHEC